MVDAVPLMLMMRPVPSAGISGMNAWVTRSAPMSLPSRSPIHSVSDQVIWRSVRRIGLPALLTTMCTVPKAARAVFGTVHIVVNNAGNPMRRTDRQILWPDTDWIGDLDGKLIGALRVTQAFLPLMPGDGTGRIINISGTASTIVWAPALTHGLNNAGMNQATGYLANDLASQQITVNTLVPGLVGTEGRQAWAENMAKQQNVSTEEFLASFCKRMGILSGRWATMDEVADSVLFIASDRGRYYNGAKIIMDGGLNVNVRPA